MKRVRRESFTRFFTFSSGKHTLIQNMENKQLDHNEVDWKKVKYPLSILAHNLVDPMNVGSIFRIADALGVEEIFLTGTTTRPPNSKLNKTSRWTEKSVSYSCEKDPMSVVRPLIADGYTIVSLEITSSSIDITKFQISANDKICLILGSENEGISQELLNLSDHTIHIPMFGQNSSMNVATACAIAVFEITKKLRG